jgi:hypothetical protein
VGPGLNPLAPRTGAQAPPPLLRKAPEQGRGWSGELHKALRLAWFHGAADGAADRAPGATASPSHAGAIARAQTGDAAPSRAHAQTGQAQEGLGKGAKPGYAGLACGGPIATPSRCGTRPLVAPALPQVPVARTAAVAQPLDSAALAPGPAAACVPPTPLQRAEPFTPSPRANAAAPAQHTPAPASPTRIHVEHAPQGLTVWLGVDGTADSVAAQARSLLEVLQRQAGGAGQKLCALICNGRVVYGEAMRPSSGDGT